ncbi:MAG: flagellar export protein FliJ [Phycisphaerales bacterium]
MRGFVFRLQPVLDQREREERDKKLALAEIERERLELENQIRTYQANIEQEQSSLAQMLIGTDHIDFKGARLQANAAINNRFAAQRTVLELAGVHHKMEQARQELQEASAQRKAVELLRDRQLEEFKYQQRRRDSLELDDMSVMRHTKREGTIL